MDGILSLITLGLVFVVPVGNVGVVTQFGNIKQTVESGLHTKTPFGIQSVRLFDTRVQKVDVKAEAASRDLQTVNTDIVVNYRLDSAKIPTIYKTIGGQEEVEDIIIKPAVNEVVKAATAQLAAEEILTKRPQLKQTIDELLSSRLATYSVTLADVSIVNVGFSADFNKAIEAKQVAEQQAQQAKFVALRATAEAEAAVNKAKGEAEAQRLQQQTLTQELLQKLAIEKWNGQFPQYYGGNVLPFLNIK